MRMSDQELLSYILVTNNYPDGNSSSYFALQSEVSKSSISNSSRGNHEFMNPHC